MNWRYQLGFIKDVWVSCGASDTHVPESERMVGGSTWFYRIDLNILQQKFFNSGTDANFRKFRTV